MAIVPKTSLGKAVDYIIDNGKLISPQLSHEDLRVHFTTGKSVWISGSGRNKVYKYRIGKQTNLGDIEISIWKELVNNLIEKNDDRMLIENLIQWVRDNYCFIRNKKDAEDYAYEMYVSQIHLNQSWFDYVAFNEIFYPDRLG